MLLPIVEFFRQWIETGRFPREELAFSPRRVAIGLVGAWLTFTALLVVVALIAALVS